MPDHSGCGSIEPQTRLLGPRMNTTIPATGLPRRGTGRCRRRGRLALGLQPSATPASAGWGSGDPPAPAVSVSVSVFFFCISLCSYAGLSNRVTERSSAVRGCRAALSHRVQTVCCLSSCSFPFSRTSILLLTSVSLTRCCLLSELSRRGFVSSSLLDLTHTCTPVFGHD